MTVNGTPGAGQHAAVDTVFEFFVVPSPRVARFKIGIGAVVYFVVTNPAQKLVA